MIEVHEGSGNIYVDLGLADAGSILVKAHLANKIAAIIKRCKLTLNQAAELVDMPHPKVSAIIRGHFRGISEEKLMRCLVALGQIVQIVVKPASKGSPAGLSVVA